MAEVMYSHDEQTIEEIKTIDATAVAVAHPGMLAVPPVKLQYLAQYGPYGKFYSGPVKFTLPLLIGCESTRGPFRGLLVDVSNANVKRWIVFVPLHQDWTLTSAFTTLGDQLHAYNILINNVVVAQADGTWANLKAAVNPFSFLSHVVFDESRIMLRRNIKNLTKIFTDCMARMPNGAVRLWTTTYQPTNGADISTILSQNDRDRTPPAQCVVGGDTECDNQKIPQSIIPHFDVMPTEDEKSGPIITYSDDIKHMPAQQWTRQMFRRMLYHWPIALNAGKFDLPTPISVVRFATGSVQIVFQSSMGHSAPIWIDRNFLCRIPRELQNLVWREKNCQKPNIFDITDADSKCRVFNDKLRIKFARPIKLDDDKHLTQAEVINLTRDHDRFDDVIKALRKASPDFSKQYLPEMKFNVRAFYYKLMIKWPNGLPPIVISDVENLEKQYTAISANLKRQEEDDNRKAELEDEHILFEAEDKGVVQHRNTMHSVIQTDDSNYLRKIVKHETFLQQSFRNAIASMYKCFVMIRGMSHDQANDALDEIRASRWREAESEGMSSFTLDELITEHESDDMPARVAEEVRSIYCSKIIDKANEIAKIK